MLLFCSGAAGLIYQVAWVRLLGLSFGVTIFAISTVLAAFMAGLAIGSLVGGRQADASLRPLRWYGFAELGVAATALLTPWAFAELQTAYAASAQWVDPASAPLVAGVVRAALAFVVLLVPTALMGATLPLAVRGVRQVSGNPSADALTMGLLYAANTTGAIVGCLLSGFVLIGQLGLTETIAVAAGANALAGLGGLALDRSAFRVRRPASGPSQTASPGLGASSGESAHDQDFSNHRVSTARPDGALGVSAAASPSLGPAGTSFEKKDRDFSSHQASTPARRDSTNREPGTRHAQRLQVAALVAFALSGAISLAYEVVWSRILAVLFDASIYGFVLMLATVLAGIAIGGALGGLLTRTQHSPRAITLAFATLELGIGVAAVLALAAFAGAFDLLTAMRDQNTPLLARFVRTDLRLMGTLCVLTVLPAALLMGATFPVAARLWAAGTSTLGRRLGGVYAGNVAGAIVGSLAAGFLLVPLLGAHHALLLLAACNVALALLLGAAAGEIRFGVIAVAAGAAALAWGALQPPIHTRVFAEHFPDQQLLAYWEGLENTVSVARDPSGIQTLFTNSRGQTNDAPDLVRYHRVMGHLAELLAPTAAPRALVVGLGAGATPGAMAQHSGTQIDVIELSPSVVLAAPFFDVANAGVLDQPNVHLSIDDGRNFLLRNRAPYDVVTADVVHPYDAGATNLYSVEYFQLVARSLTPYGIMVQWVSPGSAFEHALIVRTFLRAFPQSTLWLSGDLLIGSPSPLRLSRAVLEQRLADPAARAALAEVGFNHAQDILAQYRAGPAELAAYVGPDGPILTDDHPILEYFESQAIPPDPPDLDQFHAAPPAAD